MQIAQKYKVTIESDGQGNIRYIYEELYAADNQNPNLNLSAPQYTQANDSQVQSLIIEFNKLCELRKQSNGVS